MMPPRNGDRGRPALAVITETTPTGFGTPNSCPNPPVGVRSVIVDDEARPEWRVLLRSHDADGETRLTDFADRFSYLVGAHTLHAAVQSLAGAIHLVPGPAGREHA
jgi:hypothetical protein